MKILDKVEIGLLDNLVDMEVGAINHMYKILFFSSGKEKDNHGTRPTIKK